jgi:hypothetical protein
LRRRTGAHWLLPVVVSSLLLLVVEMVFVERVRVSMVRAE